MCNVCVDCNKHLVETEGCLCAACIDYHAMQQEEYAKYLLELEEYKAQFSQEEWEAMSSLHIDDIPF